MLSDLTKTLLCICVGLLLPVIVDVRVWEARLSLPGMRDDVTRQQTVAGDLRDGTATRNLEALLSGGSVISRFVVPHYNALAFRLFGRTAPAARSGPGGWTFIERRVAALPGWRYDELVDEVTGRIAGSVEEARRHGHRVVVAIIPDRARVYPQWAYPSAEMPAAKAAYLSRVAQRLRADGVHVVEFEPALRQLEGSGVPAFYRAGTHWTSGGAEVSAQRLSQYLRDRGLLPDCAAASAAPYDVTWKPEREEVVLLPKLAFPQGGSFEQAYTRVVPRAHFDRRGVWRDAEAPILYVTTSFGLYGSPEFLSIQTRCPVESALRRGASFGVQGSLYERITARSRSTLPRLVIWEIAEYDLYSPRGTALGAERDR